MTYDETTELLALVKGNWMRQPTDDLTIRVWQAVLKNLPLAEAWDATMELIKLGLPRPPAPGEIYAFTLREQARRAERQRTQVRLLDEPPRSAEEVARARAWLRDLCVRLGSRLS